MPAYYCIFFILFIFQHKFKITYNVFYFIFWFLQVHHLICVQTAVSASSSSSLSWLTWDSDAPRDCKWWPVARTMLRTLENKPACPLPVQALNWADLKVSPAPRMESHQQISTTLPGTWRTTGQVLPLTKRQRYWVRAQGSANFLI